MAFLINNQNFEGDIWSFLSSKFETSVNIDNVSKFVVDLRTFPITSLDQFVTLINDFLVSNNTKLNKEIFQLNEKIKQLDEKIQSYKNYSKKREELEERRENLIKNFETLDKKLQLVQDLIPVRNRIFTELQKFGTLASEKDLKKKVDLIKTSRINFVLNILLKIKNRATEVTISFAKNTPVKHLSFNLKPLFFIQILISGILIALTLNPRLTTIAVLAFIINLVLIYFYDYLGRKQRIELLTKNSFLSKNNIEPTSYESISLSLDRDEDIFLVNAAWVEALRMELYNIDRDIEKRIGKVNLLEIDSELNRIGIEIVEVEDKILDLSNNVISIDEYLNSRREIDIAVIEKEELIERSESTFPLAVMGTENLEEGLRQEIINYLEDLDKEREVILIQTK